MPVPRTSTIAFLHLVALPCAFAALALAFATPAHAQTTTQIADIDPPKATPVDTAAGLHKRGAAALRAGHPARAIPLLSRAVARRPEQHDYALTLACAYDANNQTAKADAVWQNLLRVASDDRELRVRFAARLADRDAWPQVAALLADHTTNLPSPGLALHAKALANVHGPTRGVTFLDDALRERPSATDLWAALAEILIAAGKPALALERLQSAPPGARRAPRVLLQRATARHALGDVLGATRNRTLPDGAVGRFHGAWLVVRPARESAQYVLAPPDAGLTLIRRAIDAGLDTPAAHALHARMWVAAGEPTVAWELLQTHAERILDNADPDTLALFADVAFAADALDHYLRFARRQAETLQLTNTTTANRAAQSVLFNAYVNAAKRYNERGDGRMERALLERAVALRQDHPATLLRLADALRELNDPESARRHYQRVLELEPAHPRRAEILGYLK